MRPQIVLILALVLSLLNSTTMHAQLTGGPGPPPPPASRSDHPPELPLDSEISLLIIAGIIYGFFVVFRRIKLARTNS